MIAWLEGRLFTLAFRIVVNVIARDSDMDRKIIETEIDHIEATVNYRFSEQQVIEGMLFRRFDPGPIWNAAINRAIERLKEAKLPVNWSDRQQAAFEVQQRTTTKALRNA